MAWPSSTKASTANVDAGADKISLARPDIKQNIDNVNSIIDTFDIASPSDGNSLEYDATSGQWQAVARGGNRVLIWRIIGTFTGTATNKAYNGGFETYVDQGTDITFSGNTTMIIPEGKYTVEMIDNHTQGSYGAPASLQLPLIDFYINDSAGGEVIFSITHSSTGAFNGADRYMTPGFFIIPAGGAELDVKYSWGIVSTTTIPEYIRIVRYE